MKRFQFFTITLLILFVGILCQSSFPLRGTIKNPKEQSNIKEKDVKLNDDSEKLTENLVEKLFSTNKSIASKSSDQNGLLAANNKTNIDKDVHDNKNEIKDDNKIKNETNVTIIKNMTDIIPVDNINKNNITENNSNHTDTTHTEINHVNDTHTEINHVNNTHNEINHVNDTHTEINHVNDTHTEINHVNDTHTEINHVNDTHTEINHVNDTHTEINHINNTHIENTHTGNNTINNSTENGIIGDTIIGETVVNNSTETNDKKDDNIDIGKNDVDQDKDNMDKETDDKENEKDENEDIINSGSNNSTNTDVGDIDHNENEEHNKEHNSTTSTTTKVTESTTIVSKPNQNSTENPDIEIPQCEHTFIMWFSNGIPVTTIKCKNYSVIYTGTENGETKSKYIKNDIESVEIKNNTIIVNNIEFSKLSDNFKIPTNILNKININKRILNDKNDIFNNIKAYSFMLDDRKITVKIPNSNDPEKRNKYILSSNGQIFYSGNENKSKYFLEKNGDILDSIGNILLKGDSTSSVKKISYIIPTIFAIVFTILF